MSKRTTLVFGAGGTAGHINPAIAVADAFLARYPETKIVFAGTAERLESKLVPQHGYPFVPISASPLPNRPTVNELKKLRKIWTGIADSKSLLRTLEPDVVIGTGGYVCAPLLYAATKLRIPTLLHEQNAVLGKTNKFLAKRAKTVCTATNLNMSQLDHPERFVVTGNPLRQEFTQNYCRAEVRLKLGFEETDFVVLVLGGSLGAKSINAAVKQFANLYSDIDFAAGKKVRLVVSTGALAYEAMVEEIGHLGFASLHPYLENMAEQMIAADLVVARAGAVTCAEIAAVGAASLMIPYPLAIYDHQTANAEVFAKVGATVLIKDSELSGEMLMQKVFEFASDSAILEMMKIKSKTLALPHASELIVDEIAKLAKVI